MVKQNKRNQSLEQESEEESVELYSSSEEEQNPIQIKSTPEEIRLEKAKEIIEQAWQAIQSKNKEENNEEFFIESDNEILDADLKAHLMKETLKKKREDLKNLYDSIEKTYLQNGSQFQRRVLKGHRKCITNCVIDPRTMDIYTISKDGAILKFIKLKDYQRELFQNEISKNPAGHQGEIYCIDISYDGLYLATAGQDKVIKLWDTVTKKLYCNLNGHKNTITSLQFKLNSYELFSGSLEGQLIHWDAQQKGKIEQIFVHQKAVLDLKSQTSEQIISVSYDWKASILNLELGKQLVFDSRPRSLECVASLNKQNFVTGGENGELCIWTKAKKKPNKIIQLENNAWITCIDAPFNGDTIIIGTSQGEIIFFKGKFDDMRKIEIKQKIKIQIGGIINQIKLSPDLKSLCVIIGNENWFGRWMESKENSHIEVLQLF